MLSALAAVLLLELFLLLATGMMLSGGNDQVGAPLPVAKLSFIFPTSGSPPLWLFLPLDYLANAVPLALLARWWGSGAVLAAIAGAIATMAFAVVSYLQLQAGWPFAGFPLPIATPTDPAANSVVLWLDCVLVGALAAVGWRYRLRIREPPQ